MKSKYFYLFLLLCLLKMAVVFETLFELAKPNGYPNFHGRRFSMGAFL